MPYIYIIWAIKLRADLYLESPILYIMYYV